MANKKKNTPAKTAAKKVTKLETPEQKAKTLRKRAFSPPVPMQMPFKYFDPVEAYKLAGIPSNLDDKTHRKKIFEWCRFFGANHHLIPTLMEVFAKFPIIGFTHSCADDDVKQWFDDWAESINLQDHLIALGTEYWMMGNVISCGTWSDELKCWVREELIPIESCDVFVSPVTRNRHLTMKVTDEMYKLYHDNTTEEGKLFKREIDELQPELIPFIKDKKSYPLDGEMYTQLKVGGDEDWRHYGDPIMMRVFSQLEAEMKLQRALKAVSDRLYSPLIMATVGAGANTMGDNEPWIPNDEDMMAVQVTLENAMMSDTRVMVTHFATDIKAIDLAGSKIPNLDNDFARIEKGLFQAFGINPDIISGGSNTYASTAVSADFLIQRFISYQNVIKNWLIRDRYKKMAEENEFYEYDEDGNVMMEKVYITEYDPETGKSSEFTEERKKLMIPDIIMTNMDMRTDTAQRDFVMRLRDAGVPISDKFLTGFSRGQKINFEDEMAATREEEVLKAVEKAKTNQAVHDALVKENLLEFYNPSDNINAPGTTILPLSGGSSKDSDSTDEESKNVPAESNEQKATMPKPDSSGVDDDTSPADEEATKSDEE